MSRKYHGTKCQCYFCISEDTDKENKRMEKLSKAKTLLAASAILADLGEDGLVKSQSTPDTPQCKECGYSLIHERTRVFDNGGECHVWSCENAFCSKWNLIINTEANPTP